MGSRYCNMSCEEMVRHIKKLTVHSDLKVHEKIVMKHKGDPTKVIAACNTTSAARTNNLRDKIFVITAPRSQIYESHDIWHMNIVMFNNTKNGKEISVYEPHSTSVDTLAKLTPLLLREFIYELLKRSSLKTNVVMYSMHGNAKKFDCVAKCFEQILHLRDHPGSTFKYRRQPVTLKR
jgi:hypothetical protein